MYCQPIVISVVFERFFNGFLYRFVHDDDFLIEK